MKIKTTVAALSVLSVLSFGAFAADTINAEQAQSRQAIGLFLLAPSVRLRWTCTKC